MIAYSRKQISAKLLSIVSVMLILGLIVVSRTYRAQGQNLGNYPGNYVPRSTISVSTIDDELNNDGDCSLREAVQSANTDSVIDACMSGSGADTISLPAGIYTLAIGGNEEDSNLEGDLDISGVLTITGVSPSTTILQAGTDTENGIDRVLHGLPNSYLTVESVTIRYGRTVSGGSPHINGGGIYRDVNGVLNIYYSIITENDGANGGGVVYSFSNGRIEGSVISSNNGGSGGGGIYGEGAVNVSLVHSTLANNTGAFGGGIQNNGVMTIDDSTLTGNTAFDPFMGDGYGGAIQNNNIMMITNSTISGNVAGAQGGGIRNLSRLYLRNSTITNNSSQAGGGIINLGEVVTTTNSIIANNPSGGDCSGTITSNDYNLDSDNSCSFFQIHDMPNVDPLLSALGDNGGSTWTHALLMYSPAINGGDCSNGTNLFDQRGIARPQGYACDIGAYEYNGPPFVVAQNDEYATVEDTPLIVPAPGVLENDASLHVITATLVASPVNGLIDLALDGSFIYTPTLHHSGYVTFTYQASDGAVTDTTDVSIYVDPLNHAPLAMGDTYTVTKGITLTVSAPGVLVNDYDQDSDVLTATLVTTPLSGTLSLNPDGSFVYVPDPDFVGIDSFTYLASDGFLNSDPVTVTIQVNPERFWVYLPIARKSNP